MSVTYINSIGTANPPYRISQAQTLAFMQKTLGLNPQDYRKLQILYRASAIENRYSVLEDYLKTENFAFYPNQTESFPSTSARMNLYARFAPDLAEKAIKNCLSKINNPLIINEITHLITFSCTGMYAPGLDIELIHRLGLSAHTERMCINFMGCYAAFNALKAADAICKSNPNAKVLAVGVELCTIHLQKSTQEDDLLANALFADGASAVLLESQPRKGQISLAMQSFHCDLAPQGNEAMAWAIGDFGFEMKLSSYVPELLGHKIIELTQGLLQKIKLQLSDIQWFAIHPGGRRILEAIGKNLELLPEKNQIAYEVLREFGNMSSVTVLFVLEKLLSKLNRNHQNQKVLSMAFGPGLTLESGLMEIIVA
jgi:predicted naringenin-chalcone synthase